MPNPTLRAKEEPSDLSIRLLALSLSSDCENRGVSPRNYAHRARVIRQQTELLIAAIDQERPRRTLLTMSWTMKGHASGQIDDRASGQGSAHCAHLPSVGLRNKEKYADAEPTVADHQRVRSFIRRELPAAGYSGEQENSLAGLQRSKFRDSRRSAQKLN